MGRKTPDQRSRRRVNETLNLRDANGNPTMTSTPRPRSTLPETPPSRSSANTTPATAWRSRIPTNLDISPSPSDEDPSVFLTPATPSVSSTCIPIVPSRSGGENDSARSHRVLEPLLQSAGGNERPNDETGESLPAEILQQLNTFFERQETWFNERLEQRIVAFEEQYQEGREKKTSRSLPKALTVRSIN